MTYEVVYDASTKIEMTKEEVHKFMQALHAGQEVIEFKGQYLTRFFKVIAKKEQTKGRLHDGTRVVKQFGRWVDENNPSVTLDLNYYPEIANDTVLTEEEYDTKRLNAPGIQ